MVTADLAESNGSLPPGLRLMSPLGCLPRTEISPGTLRSVIEYYRSTFSYSCIGILTLAVLTRSTGILCQYILRP